MAVNTEVHNCQHAEKTEWLAFMGSASRHTQGSGIIVGRLQDSEMGLTTSKQHTNSQKVWQHAWAHTSLSQTKFQYGGEAGWTWSPPLHEELLAWGTKGVCVSVFFEDVISTMSTTPQGRSHLRVLEQRVLTKENMKLGGQGARRRSGRIWGKMNEHDQNTFCEILKNYKNI